MKLGFDRSYALDVSGLVGNELDQFDAEWEKFMKFVDEFKSKQNLEITRTKR